jgi:hypothetical protein
MLKIDVVVERKLEELVSNFENNFFQKDLIIKTFKTSTASNFHYCFEKKRRLQTQEFLTSVLY